MSRSWIYVLADSYVSSAAQNPGTDCCKSVGYLAILGEFNSCKGAGFQPSMGFKPCFEFPQYHGR